MEFHQHSSGLIYTQSSTTHAPLSESSWPQSPRQHLFPFVNINRSTDHSDFVPSNSYLPSGHYMTTSDHLQPAVHDSPNHDISSQIEPSIGPERRVTRRQRALAQGTRGGPSLLSRENYDVRHPAYLMPQGSSRSQTSDTSDSHSYAQQPDRLPPNNSSSSIPLQLQSTGYPLTSESTSSSSYPTYYHPTHSRSTSSSNSIPRSISPGGSVASEPTSTSSSNSRTLSTYIQAPAERGSPARQQKHGKKRLDNCDRKSICQYHRDHPDARQEDIAVQYGVERSTISKILKQKVRWLNVSEHEEMRVAKHRPSKFPAVEEQLVNWLVEARNNSTVLSDALIRSKAKETARSMHIPDAKFKASSGWVENFKHRQGIRGGVWHQGTGQNVRITRAQGGGAFDEDGACMALSPLNPAFDGRSEIIGQEQSNFGLESEGSPTSEMEPPRTNDLSLPTWQVELERPNPAISMPPARPLDRSHLSSVHEPISQQCLVQHNDESDLHVEHVSISPPQQHVHEADHSVTHHDPHHDAPVTYDDRQQIPTMSEAEDAINIVITFVDTQGRGILTDDLRDHLHAIKCALFEAGSGLLFGRETC